MLCGRGVFPLNLCADIIMAVKLHKEVKEFYILYKIALGVYQ